MRHLIAAALLSIPAACLSQEGPRTVSPGMTRAQVVAALGQPAIQRTARDDTYMFYPNSCGRACGMNDLVVLQGDSVVDAIFRSPERHYTGTSSSPAPVPPKAAESARPSVPAAGQMRPPARPTDATPSIPTHPPTMKPAPTVPAPTKKPTP
jgi:hypothetical protein